MENEPTNDLLQQARDQRGWTQKELAQKLGVGESTVRHWERGHAPSPKLRSRLCDLFGMTAEELGLIPTDIPKRDHQEQPQETPTRDSVPPVAEQDPNRRSMLKRVQTCWISGFLDHSLLDHGTFMHLRLREQPDAVMNPWAEIVQQTSLPPRELPAETRIRDVYDDADGSLLLLGEPGAGKTTLLLSLTRDLIEEASLYDSHPIPVVFNLASWAEKRAPLPQWLVDELHGKYQIPRKLAQTWVAENHILPLLDGLDEVAEDSRVQCVKALNAYRQEHGLVPIVVCCRASECLALNTRLVLGKAVVIEPLDWEEIARYLSKAEMQGVQEALQSDPGLQEMASTPLMLHIIALIASVTPLDEILSVQDKEARRALIFEKYVDVVLKRRGPNKDYTSEQMIHWLAWLARYMQRHDQTQFYLERIQPDALEKDRQTSYRNMVIRLIFGINFMIDAGLYACFRGDSEPSQPGLFYWLGGKGLGNTILGWMAPGLGGGVRGGGSLGFITFIVDILILLIAGHASTLDLSWHALQHGTKAGLRNGLLFGTILAVLSTMIWLISGKSFSYSLNQGIGLWLFEGSLVALITGLTAGLRTAHATQPSLSSLDRLINFGFFAVCATVGMTSIYALQAGTINSSILIYGILAGIGVGVAFSFGQVTSLLPSSGRTIEPAEIIAWSWSNVLQELPASFKKGLLLAGAIALPTILILSIASGAFYGLSYGWHYGLIYGSIVGIINGVAAVLTSILDSGWSGGLLADDQRHAAQPNEGIYNSIKHALIAACIFGPIGGIISAICCGFAFRVAGVPGWFTLLLGFLLVYSIIFALRFWVAYGGRAGIEHLLLRWSLSRKGSLPYKVIPFLNYATERAILCRVGGGYLFSHRLLLEYFASLPESREHR